MLNEHHQGDCFLIRPSGNQPQGFAIGTLTIPFGMLPVARSDSINDAVIGFGDVYRLAVLRWNSDLGGSLAISPSSSWQQFEFGCAFMSAGLMY
jgi:hypothetical protein